MNRRATAVRRMLVGSVAALLFVTGCTSPETEPAGNQAEQLALNEGMVGADDGGAPVEGGTLSFGAFAEPRSLDPAVTIAALTTGGLEMLNIYGTLLRYDAKAKEFVPQLAERIEHDAEHKTWTLTLREGATFSNGKPLDAAAVKWSQERYVSEKGPESALWTDNVESISTPDKRTVVYELKRSWSGFPFILSTGPGMIVAKDAVGADGSFKPIGAGPFTLAEWAKGAEMVLAARDDYWGGKPHLDQVRIAYLPNTQAGLDSMAGGGIDATFAREPDQVQDIMAGDPRGYVNMTAAQNMALINATEGRPGSDPRIRRAMQLAINPQVMMERAFNGAGKGSSTIFPEYSRWHTETAGLPYDPEKAKGLLEQAKADGFDGQIEYIEASDPGSRASALAFKAQLEAVGFKVKINFMRTIADQIRKIVVDQDYDVAAWGLSFRESAPFPKMFTTMHSAGRQVHGMFTSPEMDTLIEELRAATEDEAKRQVMDKIQRQVNEDVPFLVYGYFAEMVTWNSNVHGVIGASNSMVLFSEAWKG